MNTVVSGQASAGVGARCKSGTVAGGLRVALLAASSALVLQAEAANVAIVQGDFYTSDLANQLTLAGNTVTLITSYTAASLAGYDAVIHYGNSFTDTAALQTYVFGGGTLILTPWADQNFVVPATIDVYNNNTGLQFSTLNPAVTVLDAGSPLLTGVSFPAAGTTNIGRILLTTYVGNGGEVARWSDGYGLVGMTNYGSGTSIFINMHVITSDTAYTVINQAWAATLFDNAVNFGLPLGCPVGIGNDTCLIDSTTNQATAIDADGGTDTLQVGGPTNFSFDVATIGTTFTNFETFQKVGASNVTLTGVAGTAANWDIQAGTLTVSTGNNIADTSNVNVASAATFALTASETIGSLSGAAGSFLNLNANTLTTGGDNSSTSFDGIISGTGGLTKAGTGTMTLAGINTYTGATFVSGGILQIQNNAALGSTVGGTSVANGATLQLLAANVGAEALTLNGSGFGGNGALRSVAGNNNYGGAVTLASATRINTDAGIMSINGAIGGAGQNLTVGGAGITLISGGLNTGTGTLTKDGTGSLALNGVNSFTGNVVVNLGTLQLSFPGGPVNGAIADTASVTLNAGTLLVNEAETIGSLSGADGTLLQLSSSGILTTGGNNASTSFLGTSSGAGALIKTGTGTFSTLNLGHSGLTTIAAGEMNINGNVAGGVVINSGAVLSGNTNILGSLTLNAGGVLRPGNSPGTTVVGGNFIGGGTILTEVQFNNAGAPVNGTTHDFLNIAGNASGTTLLNVVPFAPSGSPAATTGNGMELVRVGGTTGAGQFALAAPVLLGAYEYVLAYVPNHTLALDGYFLQSRLNETFFAEGAMFAASQAMMSACFRSEDGLIGDGNGNVGRAWAKVTRGSRETGADTGIATDQDYTCGSGGIDLRTGANWRFGVSGGYGDTSSDVTTAAGLGLLEGNGGMIQLHASMYHGPFFANLTAGFGQSNWDYIGPTGTSGDASLDGFVGSFQVGGLWPMGTGWRLGAIAELNYDGLDCGSNCLLPGTVADATDLFMKGTVRIDGSMSGGVVLPFFALSLSDGDENTITNGTASFTTDTNAALLGAKAGATIMIGTQTALIVNGGLTEGLNNDVSGWDGTAGVKIFW